MKDNGRIWPIRKRMKPGYRQMRETIGIIMKKWGANGYDLDSDIESSGG